MTSYNPDFKSEDLIETADQLQEIQEQLLELLGQAEELLSNSAPAAICSSAQSYWLANSKCEFSNDHGYMSRGSMTNLPETIATLQYQAKISRAEEENTRGIICEEEYLQMLEQARNELDAATEF